MNRKGDWGQNLAPRLVLEEEGSVPMKRKRDTGKKEEEVESQWVRTGIDEQKEEKERKEAEKEKWNRMM